MTKKPRSWTKASVKKQCCHSSSSENWPQKSTKKHPKMVPGGSLRGLRTSPGPGRARFLRKSRKKAENWRFWDAPGVARETKNSWKNISKKQPKNGTLKKLLFWAILEIFRIFQFDFYQFWEHFGSQLGNFVDCFCGSKFALNFWLFFQKYIKNSKNEKVAFVS